MKCLANMERITLTTDIVMSLIQLYQYKGKEFYYEDIMKEDLDYIIKQTVAREVFFLAKFLNMDITENRLRLVIKKDSVPKTKDEMLLANLKNIFLITHEKYKDIEYHSNEVLDLAKRTFKGIKEMNYDSYIVYEQNTLIRERKNVSKRTNIEELLTKYEKMILSKEYELTLLITNFYIDFINIKPLKEHNELIALLLLYAFLLKAGFFQSRYVSFFELLLAKKETFEKGILQANFNYEEGFAQTSPLHRTIIHILLSGYEIVEEFIRDYEYENDLNKSDNIENTISKLNEIFTKEEIRALHPYVSDSTINRTLKRLRDKNEIKPMGVGRSAKWIRIAKPTTRTSVFKQLDIYNDFSE